MKKNGKLSLDGFRVFILSRSDCLFNHHRMVFMEAYVCAMLSGIDGVQNSW